MKAIKILSVIMLLTTSNVAGAEDNYYVVGNPNGWNNNKSCMFYPLGNNQYSYTTYWSGAYDLLIWKADDLGDWDKCWGAISGDNSPSGVLSNKNYYVLSPPAAGYFTLTIDMNTNTYQWTALSSDYREYQNISLIGYFNDWVDDVDLTQVASHNWHIRYTFNFDTEFKFRADHKWDINWGCEWFVNQHDYYAHGIPNAENIRIGAGTYDFYFNDITEQIIIVEDTEDDNAQSPNGSGTLTDPYNVAGIIQVASGLGINEVSSDKYYFKGKISSIKDFFSYQYGNATFYISDDGTDNNQFYIYRCNYLNGEKWVEGNPQIAVGDDVIIYGNITNYNGILESVVGEAYVYSHNGKTSLSEDDGLKDGDVFTAPTVEGVELSFKIISATEKTCQVGEGRYGIPTIKSVFADNLTIPWNVNGYSVTSIGNYAFEDCSSLTSISIPNSVTSIGVGAFQGCSGLTSINIPNAVTSIGFSVFEKCSGLTSISIPNSVTSIPAFAFAYCSGLTSISIPYSVTSIGLHAFAGCSGITSIVIPRSVTNIEFDSENGYQPFADCPGLATITVDKENKFYDSRDNCNAIIETASNKLIAGCKNTVIPISVTYIASDAFDGCTELTNITIPNNVTTIRERAFWGCTGLTSITIPNSVTSIGYWAFYGCTSLTQIISRIKSPYAVRKDVFHVNSEEVLNVTLYVPKGTKEQYLATDGWNQLNIEERTLLFAQSPEGIDLTFEITDDNEGCQLESIRNSAFGSISHLTIPQMVEDFPVISIANNALQGCSSLLSISFPNSIQSIDAELLKDCSSLAAIEWNTEAALPAEAMSAVAGNPNLLLYVKNKSYAPSNIKNVIENGTADNITLKDADGGNNFYCPQAFTAKRITYEHEYNMETGYNECKGWESIVLPYDVTSIRHETGVGLTPITTAWTAESTLRPFWLCDLSADGWQLASAIKANTPYIISMPNNKEHYDAKYNINGDVTFVGENVQVQPSENVVISQQGDKHFTPSYQVQAASESIYALNVNDVSLSQYAAGSVFRKALRPIHPFEAYMTFESGNAPAYIPLFDDGEVMGIRDALRQMDRKPSNKNNKVYDLQGRHVSKDRLPKGLYVTGGRKVVIQ